MAIVSGVIEFSQSLASSDRANVTIRYEDASRMGDATPRRIAQTVMRNIAIDARDLRPIPFTIDIPDAQFSPAHSLRVHVDLDRSGVITSGDYISTRAIPLAAPSTSVRVIVDPVS